MTLVHEGEGAGPTLGAGVEVASEGEMGESCDATLLERQDS